MSNDAIGELPKPPPIAHRFVQYILGFGVSVAVGLAPFLGKLDVPLFKPLLGVLPPSEHDVAIPISALLMGFVAVVVQWYAEDPIRRVELRKWFLRFAVALMISVLVFVCISALATARIAVGEDSTAVLLHGFGAPTCEACKNMSSGECIKVITFDPTRIDGCWGSDRVAVARISLLITYLTLTSCFGALVGLLVVRGGQAQGRTSRRRGR